MLVRAHPCTTHAPWSAAHPTSQPRWARGERDTGDSACGLSSLWRDHRRQLGDGQRDTCAPAILILRRTPMYQPRLSWRAEKHRGFAFVQYEDRGDAAACIDNMNNAELFGRVLKVNVAKPSAATGGHRPGVWVALWLLSLPLHTAHCASLKPCVRIGSLGVASRHVLQGQGRGR